MIVVSDTTPLNYLVLVNAVEVLPKLFKEVYTPREVLRELTNARAPGSVRAWAEQPPSWLKVRDPSSQLPSTARLDPGEAGAISLAVEVQATVVLLDENEGRRIAMSEGLVVVRTLALLELAAERRLIELSPTLERLAATTFRISRRFIDAALARETARKGVPKKD